MGEIRGFEQRSSSETHEASSGGRRGRCHALSHNGPVEETYAFGQPLYVHLNGFSPVWLRMCLMRPPGRRNNRRVDRREL